MNELELFRDRQLDYIEIAKITGLDLTYGKNAEAEVERRIHELRKQERQRAYQKTYQKAYRQENGERMSAYQKDRNVRVRDQLREIREKHAQ